MKLAFCDLQIYVQIGYVGINSKKKLTKECIEDFVDPNLGNMPVVLSV